MVVILCLKYCQDDCQLKLLRIASDAPSFKEIKLKYRKKKWQDSKNKDTYYRSHLNYLMLR